MYGGIYVGRYIQVQYSILKFRKLGDVPSHGIKALFEAHLFEGIRQRPIRLLLFFVAYTSQTFIAICIPAGLIQTTNFRAGSLRTPRYSRNTLVFEHVRLL
jgi:hypothetical protein